MLGMDMSEQMGFEIRKGWEPFKDFLGAIVEAVVEIKDSIARRMGNQDVGVGGDSGIVAALAVGDAIAHEHRNTIELQAINLNSGVAQVMDILVKSVDVGSIEAIIMVAADENFVFVWQVAEPIEGINGFLLGSNHTKVSGMYHHIGLGQIPESAMATVGIGYVQYLHRHSVCKDNY